MIITNQALRGANAIVEWKKKVPLIGAAASNPPQSCLFRLLKQVLQLPDVPFRLLAATAKDRYRKPIPGMWYELERIFAEENVSIGAHITQISMTLSMTERFCR